MKLHFYFLLSLFIFLNACGTYYKFDTLLDNKEYEQAYDTLKQTNKTNSVSYQERELVVLLFLTLNNTVNYLPLLNNALEKSIPNNLLPLHDFSKSTIKFLSSSTSDDYSNVIQMLPKKAFVNKQIERLRLIILSHSLLNLEQYQEAFAYINASKLTANSSELMYLKALSLIKLNQSNKARSIFLTVTRISENPTLKAFSFYHLGNIFSDLQDWQQAEKYYLSAWNLNPYQAELNFRLGKVLQQQKIYSDLHYRFFRASLRLNENLAEAWFYLNI